MTDYREILRDAVTVAGLAGRIALESFGGRLAVETKWDGSPVTSADRDAERAARAWITDRYPDDSILGEELGDLDRPGARRWFIDPIDGTKAFIRGVPLWGTMIGVSDGNRMVVGVVYCPAVGQLVAAAEGLGCTCNGRPCHVSGVDSVARATILATDDRFPSNPLRARHWSALATDAHLSRTWGDCYGYVLVATGQAELMTDDRLSPWDAAALLPIIREAGGVFTDWLGRETWTGGDAIATNHVLATTLRSALGVPHDQQP